MFRSYDANVGSVLENLADIVKDHSFNKLETKMNILQHLAEVELRSSLAVNDEMLMDYLVACFAGEFNN